MPAHSSAIAHTAAQRYPNRQRYHVAANGNSQRSANSNSSTIANG